MNTLELEQAIIQAIETADTELFTNMAMLLDLWHEQSMDRPWDGLNTVHFWRLRPEPQKDSNQQTCYCWLEEGSRKNLNCVCGDAGLLRSVYKKLGMPAGQQVARYPTRWDAYLALATALNETAKQNRKFSDQYYSNAKNP